MIRNGSQVIRERVRLLGDGFVARTAHGLRHFGTAARWTGVAMTLGPRLAALPRTLAQMPNVWQTLSSRGARLELTPEKLWKLIPEGVKTREADVMAFLGKRHLSHIKSKFLHPERASDVKNVLFEKWQWNLERGSRNMEPGEVARLRLNNFAEGVAKGARATTVAAARGAILGALMELPVTAAENIILVRGRGKTGKEAWTDAARDVGKSAAAGAAGAVVVTGVAMIGVPMAPAVAVPVAVVGGTLYAYSSARRIWEARARVAASASRGTEAFLVGVASEGQGLRSGPGHSQTRIRGRFEAPGIRRYRFARRNLTTRATATRRLPARPSPQLIGRPTLDL